MNGREISGDPYTIERAIEDDEELKDEIGPNLGLTWYTIALEYIEKQDFHRANANLKIAQKYVPKSSDLNKLIVNQLQLIEKQKVEGL